MGRTEEGATCCPAEAAERDQGVSTARLPSAEQGFRKELLDGQKLGTEAPHAEVLRNGPESEQVGTVMTAYKARHVHL